MAFFLIITLGYVMMIVWTVVTISTMSFSSLPLLCMLGTILFSYLIYAWQYRVRPTLENTKGHVIVIVPEMRSRLTVHLLCAIYDRLIRFLYRLHMKAPRTEVLVWSYRAHQYNSSFEIRRDLQSYLQTLFDKKKSVHLIGISFGGLLVYELIHEMVFAPSEICSVVTIAAPIQGCRLSCIFLGPWFLLRWLYGNVVTSLLERAAFRSSTNVVSIPEYYIILNNWFVKCDGKLLYSDQMPLPQGDDNHFIVNGCLHDVSMIFDSRIISLALMLSVGSSSSKELSYQHHHH